MGRWKFTFQKFVLSRNCGFFILSLYGKGNFVLILSLLFKRMLSLLRSFHCLSPAWLVIKLTLIELTQLQKDFLLFSRLLIAGYGLKLVAQLHILTEFNPFSTNPSQRLNTLKQFVGFCQRIFWVCLTIFLAGA